MSRLALTLICLVVVAIASPCLASFHLMQIEQVIGGVNGDTSVQAIQLRMRAPAQNFLAGTCRLVARDATGSAPVTIINFASPVPNGATGSRVLVASAAFSSHLSPSIAANFTMSNLIPPSYLAAGSLTFEDTFGQILWRLSWGGAGYTGSNSGAITNDANGNFGPPFPGPLPSTSLQAVLFTGPATALSTNNAADYVLTAGAATFTNNANASGTLIQPVVTGACCISGGTCSGEVSESECAKAEGVYQGDGTQCADVDCPQPCPGDINGDAAVNVSDLLALIGAWGATGPHSADLNGDQVVNVSDLLALIGNWGPC